MIPKFRAFDKLTDTIQDVLDINFLEKTVTVSQKGIVWYRHDNLRSFEDVILMQSTGLKDKNGVEIFEGDIVQSAWYDVDNNPYKKKGEITFVGAQYVIVYDSQFDVETGEITYDAHSLTYAEDVEVIGNIYEQPELLSSGIE